MLIVKHIEELDYGKKVRECSFCGIKEDEMNANYVRHVEKCKLQHKSCDCEVTFRNPIDKERHMKLKHSKNKYIECKECPAIFGDNAKGETALRNHVKNSTFLRSPCSVRSAANLTQMKTSCGFIASVMKYTSVTFVNKKSWGGTFSKHMN